MHGVSSERIAATLADGRFSGVFDRHYLLDDIVEAFRYVQTGRKTGIVVIDVSGERPLIEAA